MLGRQDNRDEMILIVTVRTSQYLLLQYVPPDTYCYSTYSIVTVIPPNMYCYST